jgi:hypothetical protein
MQRVRQSTCQQAAPRGRLDGKSRSSNLLIAPRVAACVHGCAGSQHSAWEPGAEQHRATGSLCVTNTMCVPRTAGHERRTFGQIMRANGLQVPTQRRLGTLAACRRHRSTSVGAVCDCFPFALRRPARCAAAPHTSCLGTALRAVSRGQQAAGLGELTEQRSLAETETALLQRRSLRRCLRRPSVRSQMQMRDGLCPPGMWVPQDSSLMSRRCRSRRIARNLQEREVGASRRGGSPASENLAARINQSNVTSARARPSQPTRGPLRSEHAHTPVC